MSSLVKHKSLYHDLACPKCGTTAVDTSELNSGNYIYGDGNFLCMDRVNDKGKVKRVIVLSKGKD